MPSVEVAATVRHCLSTVCVNQSAIKGHSANMIISRKRDKTYFKIVFFVCVRVCVCD